ncbi:MAG: TIR domain-containing protein, partial [Blastocatellia bacterium]
MAYAYRYKSNQPRSGVFISYARSDGEAFARRLRERLEKQDIKAWMDRIGLEGGRDWWLQIEEALDKAEFLALVVTPKALESENVRKEWRYARQEGVCVYPIEALPNLNFDGLPRWMRDAHRYNLGALEHDKPNSNWQKFLNDLNKTPDIRRVPFMVEDLGGFVPRPEEFDQLVALLLDQNREEPVAITAALRGAGGYGKTTIAKALCHDERIQDAFDDGILWVTLGETPGDLTGRVEDLIQTLSGERPGFSNTEAAIARLKELLADRDILVVIDDVWNRDHLRPFMQGGPRCARLITTRNPNTLPDRAAEVKVDAMREAEAVALLRAGLEQHSDGETVRSPGFSRKDSAAKPLPPEGGTTNSLRALAARLGEWPLLLKLANGVLRSRVKSGETLPAAIVYANRALDKRGLKAFDDRNPIERGQAAEMTLRVSLDQLTGEDRERFSQLAIFPEDVYAPLATLEKYWGLDDLGTEELCDRLNQFSLLHSFDLGARTIRLHDVVRAFLRYERKADLTALNNQLLDAHRPDAGWAEAPNDDHYLWDHLAGHLIEAGCGEELVATVKDWRYLAKKIFLRKSHAVENDLIEAEKIAPAGDPLGTLRRGISVSSHFINRCDNRQDVESTLLARLNHLTDLTVMMQDLAQNLVRPYATPQSGLPDLPHPAL